MADVRRILDRLDRVRRSGDGWSARCPAHDDSDPSLSVAEGRNGRVLVHCFAGCSAEDVARAAGLDLAALGPKNGAGPGYTLSDYADEKLLPAAELRSWGVRTVEREKGPAVAIPYRNASGETDGTKLRAGDRFWWDSHAKLPYGLDRLADADVGRAVLLVEGESDCHACWHHGVLALGVPGANSWRSAWADLLDGRDVFVWKEPDEGGEALVEDVTATLPAARVVEAPEDAEDPAELHRRDPDGFRDRLTALAEGARPAGAEGPLADVDLMNMADFLDDPDALAPPQTVARGIAHEACASLLYADPKMGKTELSVGIGAAVSRGGAWLSHPTKRGPVLYVAAEGNRRQILRRFHVFGARPENVDVVVPCLDPLTELRTLLDARDYRLVVLDTLGRWMAPLEVDRWKQSDVDTVLTPLERTIRESGTALIALHHANAEGRPIDSTGFAAWADVLRKIADGGTERERVVTGRARFEVPDLRVRLEEDDGGHKRFVAVDPDRGLDERIIDFVDANPDCSKSEIRRGVSGSRESIDERLEHLVRSGIVDRDTSGRAHTHRIAEDPRRHGTATVRHDESHDGAGNRGDTVAQAVPPTHAGGGPSATVAGPADRDGTVPERDEPDGNADDPDEESAPDECVNCGSGGVVSDDGLCVFCRRREEAV